MMSENQFLDAFFHLEARRASREAYELLSLVKPSGMSVSHLAAEDLKAIASLSIARPRRTGETSSSSLANFSKVNDSNQTCGLKSTRI